MSVDLRELSQPRNPQIPEFGPGDTVRVQARVVEGDRERLQGFEGVVIRVKNGPSGNFTVRRVASGVGVERTFPFNSPRLESVEVTRKGRVRRSRLYYLRERTGRAARVREARRNVGALSSDAPSEVTAATESAMEAAPDDAATDSDE
jgi:large subunit ribosomal protein L19